MAAVRTGAGNVVPVPAGGVACRSHSVVEEPFDVRSSDPDPETSCTTVPAAAVQVRRVVRAMPLASIRCSVMFPAASVNQARSPATAALFVAPLR